MPKPKKDESYTEFMARCDAALVAEYPDEQRRHAVCQAQWDAARNAFAQCEQVERRFILPVGMEIRAEGDTKKKLVGYAAVFDSLTDLYWYREKIAPGAFAEAVQNDDVRCLFNHDPNLILGRNKAGTLILKEDDQGLFFEDEVPDTQVGRDTLTSVARGDITGCSFAFRTEKDEWDYTDEDNPIRTLVKVRLYDVGPVTYPAYPDTSVAARSAEAFRTSRPPKGPFVPGPMLRACRKILVRAGLE